MGDLLEAEFVSQSKARAPKNETSKNSLMNLGTKNFSVTRKEVKL